MKKRIKDIPKGISNKEIREYMLSNNFVYEATFDPVFKTIMGSCPNYLADLISNITGIDKDLIKKTFKEKNVEYKVSNALERKKTSDFIFQCRGYIINLECNNEYWEGLIERNEAYFSKIKGELLNKGEQYSKNIKVIQINFDNYKEYEKALGKELISDFKIRNSIGLIETESSIKYHINLYKIKERYYKGKDLTRLEKELLILTLDDYKEIIKISEGDEILMEVRDKLYELTNDIDNIGLYDPEKRRKEEEELKIEYHTKLAREEGIEQGIEKGIEQGIKQGIKQGTSNEKKSIAKNLLNMGIPKTDIMKATGLSKEQIAILR